jgi:hypothetical protein
MALLPESFANLTLKRRDPFVRKVADCLTWLTHNVKIDGHGYRASSDDKQQNPWYVLFVLEIGF